MPDDFEAVITDLEQQAEQQAPGVLEMLEVYGEAPVRPGSWRALNGGQGSLDTGTAPRPH